MKLQNKVIVSHLNFLVQIRIEFKNRFNFSNSNEIYNTSEVKIQSLYLIVIMT